MMTATATVKDLRTIRYAPRPGEHQLSINLGLAEPAIVFEFARAMGFTPEIVRIPTQQGVEIHALLLSEHLEVSPFWEGSLSDRLDELASRINSSAIRHVYGQMQAA